MKKYLIAGPSWLDIAVMVDVLPKDGEEFRAEQTWTRVTGSGWNAANVFEALNMEYELISPAGEGIYADEVIRQAVERQIALSTGAEGIQGSSYTWIDAQGRTKSMMLPGAEYAFTPELFYWVDPEDYAGLLTSDDAIINDETGILSEAAEAFEGKLHCTVGLGRLAEEDAWTEALCALHPVIYTANDDLYAAEDQEIGDLLKRISLKTGREVILQQNHHGVKMIVGEELKEIRPVYSSTVDRTGTTDALMAAYAVALNCGLRRENALQFAAEYSAEVGRLRDSVLAEDRYRSERDRLASLILQGKHPDK